MTTFAEGRDPQNPGEMRLSLIRWLDSRDAEHGHDQETRDEADIALEAILLDQGVINCRETVMSIHRSFWEGDAPGLPSGVLVVVTDAEDGESTGIYLSRTTGQISNIIPIVL
jgi:hypothetical protein